MTNQWSNKNWEEPEGMRRCSGCSQLFPATKGYFYFHKRAGLLSRKCKNCFNVIECHRSKEQSYSNQKAYANRYPQRVLSQKVTSRLKLRLDVLGHYSDGTFKCSCCGELHIEFLSLDHIHGGGALERKKYKNNSGVYRHLRRNNYPLGYRVLCHNCNQSRGAYGYCPHEKESSLLRI